MNWFVRDDCNLSATDYDTKQTFSIFINSYFIPIFLTKENNVKLKNPVQSKGDSKSWHVVNLHSQLLKEQRNTHYEQNNIFFYMCFMYKFTTYNKTRICIV